MTNPVAAPVGGSSEFLVALVASGMLSCCWAQDAPDAGPREQPIPEDLRDQVETSIAIGYQLYVLGKASAIALDALLEQAPDRAGVAGFLPMREKGSDPERPSFVVSFFTTDANPRVAYFVRVASNEKPVVQALSPPREVAPSFAAFARATQRALDAVPPHQVVNPFPLPGEFIGEKGILVYLVGGGLDESGVAALGPHTRVLVSEDGARILTVTPLTEAVVTVPLRTPQRAPASVEVTQARIDYPLETLVLDSLVYRLPIDVITRRGRWRVDGVDITVLGAP